MRDDEYRNLILSNKDTPRSIMKKINMPSSIFKYRCFERKEDGIIKEDPYWKESMDGTVFFSKAQDFNRNDPNDCVLYYDMKKIRDQIYRNLDLKAKNDINIDMSMKAYIESIRDNFRIGCFTTKRVEDKYMWEISEFGGKHTGFCIEYNTVGQMIYPNPIIFLPTLYESKAYDSTPIFLSLIENSGINNNELEIVSLCYNFALFKNIEYRDEQEWRILVTQNRYNIFFDKGNYKKDCSTIMKAIYLGCNYWEHDKNKEKLNYALYICKSKKIPLYMMYEVNDKLDKQCIYQP